MDLAHLRIENLRLIECLELDLAPGWNLFLGPNGAGKTSLLEAAFLLSHGRSFRSAAKDALVRHGSPGYSVFGELRHVDARRERVGVARGANRLEARLDGVAVAAAELMRYTAVVCFEPGSHELVSGSSEERRRFLDWGVFHVEHDFLLYWRRYQRALRQRNALLRGAAAPSELDIWDRELGLAAQPLTTVRQTYFHAWSPIAIDLLRELLGEMGEPTLTFHAGFDAEQGLERVLASRRGRDIARGHTTAGPHRADWSIGFGNDVRREHLSRGQEKLCAFACIMAQARLFAEVAGEWPILCLDDLASEIDCAHQGKILGVMSRANAQVLATSTEAPAAFAGIAMPVEKFHVEQGRVSRLL
ncbi:MAG: DNA replication/repair protein RecF [Dokdonella sp.]